VGELVGRRHFGIAVSRKLGHSRRLHPVNSSDASQHDFGQCLDEPRAVIQAGNHFESGNAEMSGKFPRLMIDLA
jgi:hypothetical protein